MPSKTEEYLALAQRTANGLTRYWESWTDYLTTASRLYKYSFADQLMIYAQRPDATACADYDIWNNRMNRYVRRGSKGIALLDESSGYPRLHYVFDVSDTGVRRNSRDPERWEMNDDLFKPVSEMLTAEYGISHERLSQQLVNIAEKLVNDYWDNNSGDILNIVDGSFFDDYDSSGKELQFKAAATMSVTYTLLERCGFEPEGYFDKDDFQAIHTFSTPDAVYALGAATSDISREVLRKIERTVKTTTRRRNVERMEEYEQQSELHEDRGLPAPEPDPQPAEDPAGQVRQAAPDLPEGAAPGAVPHDADEREPVPAPDGGGADGREPDAADHGAASEAEPSPGQSAEPTDVGAAHEQPESAGRGTGDDGADLQLSFLDAVLPTEAQQIEKIDRAESEKSPSAFVLSQAEIENALRRGSNVEGSKLRIWKIYQIRVWSTQEGEQRFDNHTDKLLNYIRFWQADGESEKTSVRTRTSLRQLVEEGHFKGGSAPYGYDLVKSGRINKRKHELYELHINEQEAEIVRLIFDKYVYEGYGAQRIATYLNNAGYRARSGKCWHPGSLRGMVGNLTYMGVLRCGDARSELMPELQIIPQEEFEAAQRIREDRSAHAAEEAEHHVPLRTRGQALLSNNVYCGHCGARLALTTSRKWRKLSDGTLDDTLRIRYTCYGKLRKQTDCTGQTGYTMHILDEIIDKMVRQIFSRLRGIPKEQLITSRYAKETAERKNHLQALQAERDKAEKDLLALKTEILAVIKGESAFPKDTLAEMIAAQEKKHTELETLCEEASAELERNAELMANVSQLYEELISYADLYDSASFEAKKMIVSQLIRRVEVYRGYQIHVDFNFDLAQYLENSDELAC